MYYTIVTFGNPTIGKIASHYTSKAAAIRAASGVRGGSCTTVRVLECPTEQAARNADISSSGHPTVWQS